MKSWNKIVLVSAVLTPCYAFVSVQSEARSSKSSNTSLNGIFDGFKGAGSGKDNLDDEVRGLIGRDILNHYMQL
jgi:hypothetical protein